MWEKILFFYCTILAVFLVLGSFLTVKGSGSFIAPLLLLPTLIYFLYSSFKSRKNKQSVPKPPSFTLKSLILTVRLFFLLLFAGFSSLQHSSPSKIAAPTVLSVEKQITEPQPTTTPQQIFITTKQGSVNIREKPELNSKVVSKGYNNQTYTVLQEQDSWYQIQLEGNSSGWINKEFTLTL